MENLVDFLSGLNQKTDFLIFLGGIHGVGKTTLCEKLFIPQGYHCITASSLIKEEGVNINSNKRVTNIFNNQLILVEAINKKRKSHSPLLLDGHFCLINNRNQIEPIDIEVFTKIAPSYLVLVKDYPQKIMKQLKKRDNNDWTIDLLQTFQEAEEKQALFISKKLSIPLKIITNEIVPHE